MARVAIPWRAMWAGPAPPIQASRWRGRLGARPAQLELRRNWVMIDRQPADPVQQLVRAQPPVADQRIEVLHEHGIVNHGQARQLHGALAEGAGLLGPAAVERRVRSGVAHHRLQAPLLVGGQLGPWLLAPGRPQGRDRIGQAPPVIANRAGHRIPRSCRGPLPLVEASARPRTASSSSLPMRRASTPSTVCGW
jgi:hypothetical protein